MIGAIAACILEQPARAADAAIASEIEQWRADAAVTALALGVHAESHHAAVELLAASSEQADLASPFASAARERLARLADDCSRGWKCTVSFQVVALLARWGAPSNDVAFAAALDSSDRRERMAAVMALGRMGGGTPERIVTLLQHALVESDAAVRFSAVEALRRLRSLVVPCSIPLLHELSERGADWFDVARRLPRGPLRARGSVADWADALARRTSDPAGAALAAEALGCSRAAARSALPELLEAVGERNDGGVRAAALLAAARVAPDGEGTFDRLLRALTDDAADVRMAAAIGLGELGERGAGASAALRAALDDPAVWDMWAAAAWALGQVAGAPESVVEALAGRLRPSTSAHVRESAALGLGHLLAREAPSWKDCEPRQDERRSARLRVCRVLIDAALRDERLTPLVARLFQARWVEFAGRAFVDALDSDDRSLSDAAARALLLLAPAADEVAGALARHVQAGDEQQRALAAAALAQQPACVDHIDALLDALSSLDRPSAADYATIAACGPLAKRKREFVSVRLLELARRTGTGREADNSLFAVLTPPRGEAPSTEPPLLARAEAFAIIARIWLGGAIDGDYDKTEIIETLAIVKQLYVNIGSRHPELEGTLIEWVEALVGYGNRREWWQPADRAWLSALPTALRAGSSAALARASELALQQEIPQDSRLPQWLADAVGWVRKWFFGAITATGIGLALWSLLFALLLVVFPRSRSVRALVRSMWRINPVLRLLVCCLIEAIPRTAIPLLEARRREILGDAAQRGSSPGMADPIWVIADGHSPYRRVSLEALAPKALIIAQDTDESAQLLRSIARQACAAGRYVVYLLVEECDAGVESAILQHFDKLGDLALVDALLRAGPVHVCVEGYHRATDATRQHLRRFSHASWVRLCVTGATDDPGFCGQRYRLEAWSLLLRPAA